MFDQESISHDQGAAGRGAAGRDRSFPERDGPGAIGMGAEGQASDIEITAREILKLKKELYDIIAKHSGQTYETVEKNSDRDYWMTAEEAKTYGMIDEILVRNKK